MKDKAKRVRSASQITYQKELGVIKYKFSIEEETLVQQLGLDRFLSVVTWGVNNPEVMAEVVEGLDMATFETQLNGSKVHIFNTDWRVQMQSIFYLTPHQRNVDATDSSNQVNIQKLFPNLRGMKKRPENLKISECKLLEWRKPLRLLNSLLLLRTDASTIPSKFVQRLLNVINGEKVDWREELYDNIRVELLTLHQALFKEETSITRTMVGPHVVILLAVQGHMTVEQESKAGIWDPFKSFEKEEQQQKRAKIGLLSNLQLDMNKESEQNKVASNEKRKLVVELAGLPEKNGGSSKKPKEVTVSATTSKAITGGVLQRIPEIAVCTILTQDQGQKVPEIPVQDCNPLENKTKTGEGPVQDVASEPKKQQSQTNSTSAKGVETIRGIGAQLYSIAKRYEQFINHMTTIVPTALSDALEREVKGDEDKEQREDNIIAYHGKKGGETHDSQQGRVTELEKQLSDIQQKHSLSQEELSRAQEKLQAQSKLEEENHKLAALLAEQQREKGEVLKEVASLQEATKINNIVHKQKEEIFQKTEQEIQEKYKINQDKLNTEHIRVKELESQVKAYQQKDEGYMEALIRAAAFETWVNKDRSTKEGVREFQTKVAEMTQETIQVLHTEVERLIQEKDELHNTMEEMNQIHPSRKPEFKRDMEHAISALHHLPPAISIRQNFQAIRGLIFVSNGIPLLSTGAKLSQEEIITFWRRSGPSGRDALAFMWALGELKAPLGVFELVSVNPAFYVSRYCIQAMKQIAEHHRGFYTNTKYKGELPVTYQYTQREIERIQAVIDQNKDESEKSKRVFAQEDLSIFAEAVKCHQWLKKYHSDSFPPKFFETDLQHYVSNTLNNFEATVAKGNHYIHNQDMMPPFSSLDPRQWKNVKRS